MLKSRDDHVAHVLDDAKTQLAKIAHDRSKYPAIIENLIAQVSVDLISGGRNSITGVDLVL